jgi:hypothetical protein
MMIRSLASSQPSKKLQFETSKLGGPNSSMNEL